MILSNKEYIIVYTGLKEFTSCAKFHQSAKFNVIFSESTKQGKEELPVQKKQKELSKQNKKYMEGK